MPGWRDPAPCRVKTACEPKPTDSGC
jgi:hypothetical protein